MAGPSYSGIYGGVPGLSGKVSMVSLLLDADRSVCEIEARRAVMGDCLVSPADGVHEVKGTTYHVMDGVLHREDGPAVENMDTGYREWRFRGNLHRDGAPALTQDDQAVWYRHGLEHRVDGPSTIIGDDREYRQFDQLHRIGAPAIDNPWFKEYQIMGRRHRDDGPAVINANSGVVEYYRGNLLHRDDGPALETAEGVLGWFKDGELHNASGAAWHHPVDGDSYALDGVEMSESQFHETRKTREPALC
jgi:hypothetical protein